MATIIMGIDPGSRITGYGVIQVNGNKLTYTTSGCIKLKEGDISSKLRDIFKEISQIVEFHKIDEVAIEEVFFHQNPKVALKLGHARGAAIVGAISDGRCKVFEYSARQVKQSVVGYGAAQKEQVQHMILRLLNLSGEIQVDSADALAVAICHAFSRKQYINNQISTMNQRGTKR